ncbi:MAG: TerB family tellurite resistance protein [Altibacter sp.]|uniref:tellurite resistance TerB family protein n=1 Tax=Altibacter sp. TaxID=2024823 RepID=UPI001E1727B2|nr:TerB family tellurite resistance protein [Altibacter sp.]MBZ0326009.1 TerB family tellurite resistance protein [Altibacter sp.]
MDKETNRALLSDLILLAQADNKVTDSEYDFIIRIAEQMGLSEADVTELFDNPLPSKPQNSELQRLTHFYKLVLVMNVDRETHEKEIIAVRNFGLKMGIRPGVVDQILLRMNDYKDKIIPTEELLKIFQTYYN